jgi:hypothetical protein
LATKDGSETATADVTEYFLSEAPTAIKPCIISTNSIGVLALLKQMITISLDEEYPNGDVVARLF